MSGGVDPGFSSSESGRMSDTGAYNLGNWTAKNVLPNTLGVFGKSMQPVQIGTATIPGWVNALATGGLAGMALGGLYRAKHKKPLKKGLIGGGLLGAGALATGAYVMNTPNWFSKIPGIGAFAGQTPALQPDTNVVPTSSTGRPLANVAQPVRASKSGSTKQAEFGTTGGESLEIIQKIWRDTALSQQEKQTLAQEVANLATSDQVALNRLVKSTFGAGVGYLVAKYLFGRGKRGIILSTILGAVSGAIGAKRDRSKPTHNRFGQAYYF